MRYHRLSAIVAIFALFSAPAAGLAATVGPSLKPGWTDLPESSLTARSAIVLDRATGKVLFHKNPDAPRVPASLTKVMTSIIFIERRPTLAGTFRLTDADEVGGGRLRVATGTVLTMRDLLYSSLVGSANNAAMGMMHASGLADAAFVKEMNVRAATLGLSSTRFVEPSGMSERNMTTARDMAKLVSYAFGNPTLRRVAQTGRYRFTTVSPAVFKDVKSTNQLLLDPDNGLWVTGGKTGYTEEAGYNLTVTVKTMHLDKELVVVVLGADTKERSFAETERLAKWAWENYAWTR